MDNMKFDRETLQELAEPEPIPEAARLTVSDYLNMSREEADAKGVYLPWKLAHKQHEKEIKWASFRDEYGRLKNWQQLAAIPKDEAMTMPSDLYQLWSLAQIKKSALSKVVKARNEAIREIRVTAKPVDLKPPLPFGATIAKLRKDRKISQTQAAEFFYQCGLPCSHNLISKWERGGSEPRLTDLVALSILYGTDLLALMTKEAQKPERDLQNAESFNCPDPTGRI